MDEANRGMGVTSDRVIDDVGLLQGTVTPSAPVVFRHAIGRVPSDLMLGGSPFVLLISDRFQEVLKEHAFTGWATYPVAVQTKRGAPIPGYSGLAITGRAGDVDWNRSESSIRASLRPDGHATHSYRGMYFDEASWDRSDLFLLGDTGRLVVTAAVRDALRAAKIRNVAFTRLTEVQTSVMAARPGAGRAHLRRH